MLTNILKNNLVHKIIFGSDWPMSIINLKYKQIIKKYIQSINNIENAKADKIFKKNILKLIGSFD